MHGSLCYQCKNVSESMLTCAVKCFEWSLRLKKALCTFSPFTIQCYWNVDFFVKDSVQTFHADRPKHVTLCMFSSASSSVPLSTLQTESNKLFTKENSHSHDPMLPTSFVSYSGSRNDILFILDSTQKVTEN